jgi:hypothetical protein
MKVLQRTVLVLIGLYHVGFAVLALASAAAAKWIARVAFGVFLDGTPQVMYISKLLGIYGLAFGGTALLAASNPAKYRPLIWVILGLYVLRVLDRAVFLPLVRESFAVSPARITAGCVLLGLFGLTLLISTLGSRQPPA